MQEAAPLVVKGSGVRGFAQHLAGLAWLVAARLEGN